MGSPISISFYGAVASFVPFFLYVSYVLIRKQRYLQKYPVPFLGFAIGQTFRILTGITTFVESDEEYYQQARRHSEPIVAITDVIMGKLNLLVTDLDIIKRVLVKDFEHFVNVRPTPYKNRRLTRNIMMFMRDERWKANRGKMTPAFSPGKTKRLHKIMHDSTDNLIQYLKNGMGYPAKKSVNVDFTVVMVKYLMNIIANTAFGIDIKSWETPLGKLSAFEQIGKKFEFRLDSWDIFKYIVMQVSPTLGDILGLDIVDVGAQKYIAGVVIDVVKKRRESGERREDFLQLMMDIQMDMLKLEEDEQNKNGNAYQTNDCLEFDDDALIANSIMFFVGGFDTTQTTLLFLIYCLALEQQVQEKLLNEITIVMKKHKGILSYEALGEMTYFDMVISESQRLYPVAPRLERECTKDFVVPETGLKIEKGTIVLIPKHGIHKDERYWPNPETFDPERFSPEKKMQRNPYTFMPFGHGPRSCIGVRFATLSVKTVIAKLLLNFRISFCSKSRIPVRMDSGLSVKPVGGMWVKLEARQ